LAVFAGAFTLEDAAEVLTGFYDKQQVTRAIQILLDRHLIVRSVQATVGIEMQVFTKAAGQKEKPHQTNVLRFAFLDAVKQFAEEQFIASSDQRSVEQAHIKYFIEKCQTLTVELRAGRVREATAEFAVIEKEGEKVLSWLREHGALETLLRMIYFVTWLQFSSANMKSALSHIQNAMPATPPQTERERTYASWCHYIRARCQSFEGQHKMAIKSARMAQRLSKSSNDDLLHTRIASLLVAESAQRLELSRARQNCQALIRHHQQMDATHQLTFNYIGLFTIELIDGNFAQSLVAAKTGFDLAVQVPDGQMAAINLVAQAEAYLCLGQLRLASNRLEELAPRYDPFITPIAALRFKYTELRIAFEQCDVERVHLVLMAICNHPSTTVIATFRVSLLVLQEITRAEFSSGASSATELQTNIHLLRDGDWCEIWVRYWIHKTGASCEARDWKGFHAAIDELIPILGRTKNSLWYSWLVDACAHALVVNGEWKSSRLLLDYSKQLIASAGAQATPRQQRTWQKISDAIDAEHTKQASMLTPKSAAQLSTNAANEQPQPSQWAGTHIATLRALKEYTAANLL
jgi:hypothetical protein